MVFFLYPWMLLAALSLPVLVAIYKFRGRSRDLVVSCLDFWRDEKTPSPGGRVLKKLPLPLSLLLELLVLGLLSLAAAAPFLPLGETGVPLVVVLDDSFSMRTVSIDELRKKLDEVMDSERPSLVEYVLAGKHPRMLKSSSDDFSLPASGWRRTERMADMGQALGFVRELRGGACQVLVVSDHAPPDGKAPRGVRWLSLGDEQGNPAIVNAARGEVDDRDRLLFELANYGLSPCRTELMLRRRGEPGWRHGGELDLPAGGKGKLVLSVPLSEDVYEAKIAVGGALAFDDEVVLAPLDRRRVRCRLDVDSVPLAKSLAGVLACVPEVDIVDDAPHVLFSDQPGHPPGGGCWPFRFITAGEGKSDAYQGPFVIDRACPLTAELDLTGVVWARPRGVEISSRPVISAGSVPLMVMDELSDGAVRLVMLLSPELSTLTGTPEWPIMFSDLINWRRRSFPGPVRRGLRTGEVLKVALPSAGSTAALITPDGSRRELPGAGIERWIDMNLPGLYEIEVDGRRYAVAVNPLAPAESDLRRRRRGEWGGFADGAAAIGGRDIAWSPMVLALAVMVLHLICTSSAGFSFMESKQTDEKT